MTAPTADSKRIRMLVIDDEERLLASLVRLCRARCDVVTATGPLAAMDVIRNDRLFDIILCDLVMPELSGADLRDAVAAFAPELRRRFVFMSASCGAPDAHDVMLCKPFGADQLFAQVLACAATMPTGERVQFPQRTGRGLGEC